MRYQDGGSLLPHKVEAGSVVEQLGWVGEEVVGIAITDKSARKKLKRASRKKAAPKTKRAAGVARGDNKKKVKKIPKGQRKR